MGVTNTKSVPSRRAVADEGQPPWLLGNVMRSDLGKLLACLGSFHGPTSTTRCAKLLRCSGSVGGGVGGAKAFVRSLVATAGSPLTRGQLLWRKSPNRKPATRAVGDLRLRRLHAAYSRGGRPAALATRSSVKERLTFAGSCPAKMGLLLDQWPVFLRRERVA